MCKMEYQIWVTTCDGNERNPAWESPPEPSAENVKTYTNQTHVTNYLRGRKNDENNQYPMGAYEVVCFPKNDQILSALERKKPEHGHHIEVEVHTINAWEWLQGKRPQFVYQFRLVNDAHETLTRIYRIYKSWYKETDGGAKAKHNKREHGLLWHISDHIVGYAVSHIKE